MTQTSYAESENPMRAHIATVRHSIDLFDNMGALTLTGLAHFEELGLASLKSIDRR